MSKKKGVKASLRTNIPLYGGAVYLFREQKMFNKAVAAMGVEVTAGSPAGQCMQLHQEKTGHVLYLVGWFDKDICTLVHECGHLAIFALVRAGVKVTGSKGEAFCYLQEALVRSMMGSKK